MRAAGPARRRRRAARAGDRRQRRHHAPAAERVRRRHPHDRRHRRRPRDAAKALSEPFTLYQAGFDASWELDLGPRAPLHRGADADVVRQAALLDLARLTLASDLAQLLRTAHRPAPDPAGARGHRRAGRPHAYPGGARPGGTVGQLDGAAARRLGRYPRATAAAAGAGGGQHQPDRAVGRAAGALRDELADQETGAGINMDRGKGAGKSTPPARRPCPTWRWACLPRSPGAGSTSAPPKPGCTAPPPTSKPGCTAPPPTSAWPRPTCIPAFAWARMFGVVPERRVLGLGQPGLVHRPQPEPACSTMAAARAWWNCASWSSRKRRSTSSGPCSRPGRRSTTRSTPTRPNASRPGSWPSARAAPATPASWRWRATRAGRWMAPWRWTASGAICSDRPPAKGGWPRAMSRSTRPLAMCRATRPSAAPPDASPASAQP